MEKKQEKIKKSHNKNPKEITRENDMMIKN